SSDTSASSQRLTTSPVRSPVSVSDPIAATASYSFSPSRRKRATFVPSPTSTMSRPVAKGSRVPPCPIRSNLNFFLSRLVTSAELKPAGLSTRSTPSRGRFISRLSFPAEREHVPFLFLLQPPRTGPGQQRPRDQSRGRI